MKITSLTKRFFMLIALALAIAAFFAACGKPEPKASFKVEFMVGGEVYHTATTDGQQAIVMPAIPQMKDYGFGGWYLDEDIWQERFTEDTVLDITLTEGIKVYAKWWEKSVVLSDFLFELKDSTHYYLSGYTGTDTKITVPAECNGLPVAGIGPQAFKDNTSITEITVPSGITSIGFGAFSGCDSLTDITLPFVGATLNGTDNANIGFIFGTSDFFEHRNHVPSSLKSVTITQAESIGEYAFFDCNFLTSVILPDSVTSIGYSAFENCISLTSVTMPDSVTSIGENAFYDCSSLTSVTIPDSITIISDYMFFGCSSLTSVVIPDRVTSIGLSAFYGTGLTSITIPDNVKNIGGNVFKDCDKLESITFAENSKLLNIGGSMFSGCSSLTGISIPDGVGAVGSFAFAGCTSLTGITIPDSVTIIGDSAFSGCDSLTDITLPFAWATFDGMGNTHFGYVFGANKFSDNGSYVPSSLKSVTITKAANIEDRMFSGCSSLTNITLPDDITSIGNNAFSGCGALIGITLPDSVTEIGYSAFSGCKSLTGITLPDGITSIGGSAFSGCSSLTSITLPDSVTKIEEGTFGGCSSLTSITLPDSVTEIGDYAFSFCSSLTEITLPDGVTEIGDYAFGDCNFLTIYAEAASRPSGWSDLWNSDNRPVVWGHKG